MSVVVAIKENGKVYIGADSQVTKGGTRSTLKNKNNYKIWAVKNVPNCYMAHVGNVRDANIVRLIDDLVTEYDIYKNRIDYEFVVRNVVQQIFRELKEAGYLKDEQYIGYMDSSFLFAYRDQLYQINTDGCVLEIDDCVAIGSGCDQAVGSLLSTEGQEPIERITKAIKATAASDIYVDYPIVLTNTDSDDFTIVYEDQLTTNKKGKNK